MTGKVTLVPSVLPMNGIRLSPPIPVRVMRKRGALEPGKNYYLGYVLPAGECLLYTDITLQTAIGSGRIFMTELVELVTTIEGANDNSPKSQ